MSTSAAAANNGSLKMDIVPAFTQDIDASLVSLENTLRRVNFPIKFSGLTFCQTSDGVYTPANDTDRPINFTALQVNPTWLLVIVDQLTNMQLSSTAGSVLINELTIAGGIFFLTGAALTGNAAWDYVTFDGHASLSNGIPPMTQGTPVNYFIACGDGTPQ